MSTYFIDFISYPAEDIDTLYYHPDTGEWENDSGLPLDDSDIDSIGRDILEEFEDSSDDHAYIHCDYLDMEFELCRAND